VYMAALPVAAIPTQELTFNSNDRFNALFRIACCNHPQLPNPAQNNFIQWIQHMIPANQRSQPFKGWADNQAGTVGAYYGELQHHVITDIPDPANRGLCLEFCNGVRDVVLGIQQHLQVNFNRWSFDLQVRRANTPVGIQGENEDYHHDGWGAWTPFGMNQPRYVICVYWQNYFPVSRTLQVGNPGVPGIFMGDVQYLGPDNWPFKVAIVDQQQFRHRPATPNPQYGAQTMAANPGENWRVMLRIHADTDGPPRRYHGGAIRSIKSKIPYFNTRSKSYRSKSARSRPTFSRSKSYRSKSMSSIQIHEKPIKFIVKQTNRVPKFKASNIVYLTKKNESNPEILKYFPENKHWLV